MYLPNYQVMVSLIVGLLFDVWDMIVSNFFLSIASLSKHAMKLRSVRHIVGGPRSKSMTSSSYYVAMGRSLDVSRSF